MFGCFFKTSANAKYSFSVYFDPLGLLGELKNISFVFGVIAASKLFWSYFEISIN